MVISPVPSLCCISDPVSLNVFIYFFNFLFQVIPSHLPLETEIRENCCVLTPGYHYVAGRVHEIKGNKYRVEKLIDANRNYKGQTIRLHSFEREKLRVIFSAWCGKHRMNIVLCMNYLREISQFVFFNNSILNNFSCSSINYINTRKMPNHFTLIFFAAKGAIYYVAITTVIFSFAKITCCFHHV